MNCIENNKIKDRVITQTYLATMQCEPRPLPVGLAGRANLKTPWDWYKSIFRTYRLDTEKLINDCFEYDWNLTKCKKIIRGEGEADKVKAFIKQHYRAIRETYKFYSGISPMGRVTCVLGGTMSEIIQHCPNLLDGKYVKISDIDLAVIACNGGRAGNNYLSPNNALVRFQFIEVLCRLAADKYFKPGVVPTYSEAVVKLFEENVLPFFE